MASSMKGFEHLEIQLEEIKSATNYFSEENVIGHGGFGKVYKGELSHSHSDGKTMVALKRLDRRHGQGDGEFYKEVRMLSCYKHENIISLVGFSSGQDEMILVYEYASRGSLDGHLQDVNLTWTQRLKICLDASKGLYYLHDPRETYQRLIHCDIKSANILLDENFNAKVADFGLSKIGPANQQNSILVTGALGTLGYCDPEFMDTYSLTKESDVYSFGVVLFEVLSGKLCFEISNGQLNILVPMWKRSYEQKQLSGIVFQGMAEQMNPDSLETFADIAYKCLKRFREERPAMSLVVEKLQESLALQELHDSGLRKDQYEEIIKGAVPPLKYRSLDELKMLLTEGFHVNEGKTRWLFVNEKGEHIERIYIEACLDPDQIEATNYLNQPLLKHLSDDIVNSRFPGGRCYEYHDRFKARVRGQCLTPQISYTLNLVFRFKSQKGVYFYNPLRYKLDGENETKVFIIYPSTQLTEDGWFVIPLYHFTSQHKTADLQFEFESRSVRLLVAGIEFQPSEEKVELQVFEEYQHIVQFASQSLAYRSLQELEHILSVGIHLKDYKTWFSLNEKGEHCHMISMEDCLIPDEDSPTRYQSRWRSRFPAGFFYSEKKGFRTHIKTQLLNPLIRYTVNLVFHHSTTDYQLYVDLKYRLNGETRTSTVYLAESRSDCLFMAELYQVTSNGGLVDLEIDFENPGIVIGVEGILFQPLEKVEDKVVVDDKGDDLQPILSADSHTYWGQKLPNGSKEIMELSKHSVKRKTNKELYSILCQGFLIDNCQQWFTIDKNGKKCLMLSTRATCVTDDKTSTWKSSNESRFGEVLVITSGDKFNLKCEIKPTMLSCDTTYACYLVYKLPEDQSTFDAPMFVWEKDGYTHDGWYIFLESPPNTPIIGQRFNENGYNPLNRHKLNALPRKRSDGWMEVKVWEFQSKKTPSTVSIRLRVEHPVSVEKDLRGLIIQGIEIGPI